jgi:hypothetical protein
MKNYIFIFLFILISAGCSRKQRYDDLVGYGNFWGQQETFIIKVDCPFLTDGQFNQVILDTTKIYKFDRDSGIQLLKELQRLDYKYQWDNPNLDMYHKIDIEDSTMSFYCVGRLNLQSNVNSLIIMKSSYDPYLNEDFVNSLWLFNIKDNQIRSVIELINFAKINAPLCPSICIKNKIFEKTEMEADYWFIKNFGQRFPRKDKELFSTFTIDENGFLQFIKD